LCHPIDTAVVGGSSGCCFAEVSVKHSNLISPLLRESASRCVFSGVPLEGRAAMLTQLNVNSFVTRIWCEDGHETRKCRKDGKRGSDSSLRDLSPSSSGVGKSCIPSKDATASVEHALVRSRCDRTPFSSDVLHF